MNSGSNDVWFIIGSGPSLTAADCRAVRGLGQILAINNAVFYAPFADYLYAGDLPWWKEYAKQIEWFKGRKISVSPARHYGAQRIPFESAGGLGKRVVRLGPENSRNSGLQAINWAYLRGGRQIFLIGHDGKPDADGRLHVHDDHPHPMGNCGAISRWPDAYTRLWRDLDREGVRLVNCSRETAHTIPWAPLETIIEELNHG